MFLQEMQKYIEIQPVDFFRRIDFCKLDKREVNST